MKFEKECRQRNLRISLIVAARFCSLFAPQIRWASSTRCRVSMMGGLVSEGVGRRSCREENSEIEAEVCPTMLRSPSSPLAGLRSVIEPPCVPLAPLLSRYIVTLLTKVWGRVASSVLPIHQVPSWSAWKNSRLKPNDDIEAKVFSQTTFSNPKNRGAPNTC